MSRICPWVTGSLLAASWQLCVDLMRGARMIGGAMKFFAAALICLAGLPALRATPVRDLQHELKLDDTGWQVRKETDNSILWITPQALAVTLVIQNVPSQDLDPRDTERLRDFYRQHAISQHGSLVEADSRRIDGIFCDLETIKYLPAAHPSKSDPGGLTYQTRVIIPTTLGSYELSVVGTELGITGLRDTTGLVKKPVPTDGSPAFTLKGDPGVILTLDGNYACSEVKATNPVAAAKKVRMYMFTPKDDQSGMVFQVGSEVNVYSVASLKEQQHAESVRRSSGEINGNRVDWLRYKDDAQRFCSAVTVTLKDDAGTERW